MTLDDIFEVWKQDSQIDRTELDAAALKIPQLHYKYFKMYSNERLIFKKLEMDFKKLRLEKSEFYLDGPTKEQIELGWKLPAKGKILRSDVGSYVDADSDIIEMNLKLAYQNEKLQLLESIIKCINNMGFQIKNVIEWEKFKVGL